MTTRLTLFFALLLAGAFAQAQFSLPNYAFQSETKYPVMIWADDLNGDGAEDALIREGNLLRWWPNDGTGNYGEPQLIFDLFISQQFKLQSVDLSGDGAPDIVCEQGWWLNDGTGQFTFAGPFDDHFTLGVVADLDGDGDVDLYGRTGTVPLTPPFIVTYTEGPLWNDGTGNFTIGAGFPYTFITSYTLQGSAADLTGDGLVDLVIGGNNNTHGWYANLGGGAFGPRQVITDLAAPNALTTGDIDGDGDTDLLAYDGSSNSRWFANDGSGAFTLGDTIPTFFSTSYAPVLADRDADGDLDLNMSTGTDCNVAWYRNNMADTTWSAVSVENFNGYNLVGARQAMSDADGDGDDDLLICNGLGVTGWYPNNGAGNYGARERLGQTLGGGNAAYPVDVDGDGDLDLVASAKYGDMVSWYANNGDGTFGDQQVVAEHLDLVVLVGAMDLDGDGDPDLLSTTPNAAVIRNTGSGNSWSMETLPGLATARKAFDVDGDGDKDLIGTGNWYANDGSGVFTAVPSAALTTTGDVSYGDLNGDGTLDLVIGGSAALTALLNDGFGNFTSSVTSAQAFRVCTADLDGDGDLDVAAFNNGVDHPWFENDGAANFTAHTWITNAPVGFNTLIAWDVNNDALADIIWSRSYGYEHELYFVLNEGGTFSPNTMLEPNAEPTQLLTFADLDNDAVEDLVMARFHSLTWQENHFFDAFRLRGEVFKDFNANGVKDGFDEPLQYLPLRTDPAGNLTWTNSIGRFDLPVDSGTTYHLWPHLPSYFLVTSTPDTAVVQANNSEPIVDSLVFGIGPAVDSSLEMITLTSSVLRCNTDAQFWLTIRNTGSWISTGILIDMDVLPDLTFVSAYPSPDSISGGHVYWHLDSLPWFAVHNFMVEVMTGPVGSTAALVLDVTFQNNPHSEHRSISQTVTCAFDPNDKLVDPVGYGPEGAVDIDTEWLDYTIRFQNTGTDTAFSVVLVDQLSDALDPASMEILGASHDLSQIVIDATGELQFRFEPILLPDSGANLAGSNGYVRYRIRPVDGLTSGTVITNTAAIYFDLNSPVITNTVVNTLIDCDLFEATITDLNVDLLQASEAVSYQWFLNGDSLLGATSRELTLAANGDYTVQTTSTYGCVALSDPYTFLSTAVPGPEQLQLALMPNPSDQDVRLLCATPLQPKDRVFLLDMHGRSLREMRGTGQREMIITRGGLNAGIYLVQVVSATGVQGSRRLVLVD